MRPLVLEPGKSAVHALGITRSWAKMEEFSVPPADRIAPTISVTAIADNALGIIGDAAAGYGDVVVDTKRLGFVSQYFDSLAHGGDTRPFVDYARLLAASAYYLSDSTVCSRKRIPVTPSITVSRAPPAA